MTKLDRFDDKWYTSTYPHVIYEAKKMRIPRVVDHWKNIGIYNKLSHNYSQLKFFRGRKNDSENKLFANPALSRFATDEFLYDINPEDIARQFNEIVLNPIQYYSRARDISEGEIHYSIMIALENWKIGNIKESRKCIYDIDIERDMNEFHAHMVFCLLSMIGNTRDAKKYATSICDRFGTRIVVYPIYIPPALSSGLMEIYPTPISLRLLVWSPFSVRIKCMIKNHGIPGVPSPCYQDSVFIPAPYRLIKCNYNFFDFRFSSLLTSEVGDFFKVSIEIVAEMVNGKLVNYDHDIMIPLFHAVKGIDHV